MYLDNLTIINNFIENNKGIEDESPYGKIPTIYSSGLNFPCTAKISYPTVKSASKSHFTCDVNISFDFLNEAYIFFDWSSIGRISKFLNLPTAIRLDEAFSHLTPEIPEQPCGYTFSHSYGDDIENNYLIIKSEIVTITLQLA